ncbi:MAG: hypothetical protein CMJ98_00280 [Planctomycetes bacterium]|jgi:hypothetical protein|nr:hypothetical protein [Planctomycetota bacterium]HJM57248.1 hypothetical protein [Planctomycetota bacterium]
MNALNHASNALFDLVLTPLEALGEEFALIMVSGIFGILALIVFKQISSQKGIKAAKDRIKGHMIEIRIYQNDLVLVSRAIGKVLLRNLQYVGLNFGPFIPLSIPFAFVIAQMVVRYGFIPVPVQEDFTGLMAGKGLTVKVELAEGYERQAPDLELILPDGVEATSPLVAVPAEGYVFQEIVATRSGEFDLKFVLGGTESIKQLAAGDVTPRALQPERVSSFLSAVLWPAEDTFPEDSGIARVSFVYPESDLGWLPGSGPMGVILVFLVASMAFGIAALKPLGVQI